MIRFNETQLFKNWLNFEIRTCFEPPIGSNVVQSLSTEISHLYPDPGAAGEVSAQLWSEAGSAPWAWRPEWPRPSSSGAAFGRPPARRRRRCAGRRCCCRSASPRPRWRSRSPSQSLLRERRNKNLTTGRDSNAGHVGLGVSRNENEQMTLA